MPPSAAEAVAVRDSNPPGNGPIGSPETEGGAGPGEGCHWANHQLLIGVLVPELHFVQPGLQFFGCCDVISALAIRGMTSRWAAVELSDR